MAPQQLSAHTGHQATCAPAPTARKAVYDLSSNGDYGRVLVANLPVRLQQFCKGWMSGVTKNMFLDWKCSMTMTLFPHHDLLHWIESTWP